MTSEARGFCPGCGNVLNHQGRCARCSSRSGTSPGAPTGPSIPLGQQDYGTGTVQLAGSPIQTAGRLPKAGAARRLLGSGIEFLAYCVLLIVIAGSSLSSGTLLSLLNLLPCALVLARDVDGGSLSLGKRIAGMRVVDRKTWSTASNGQALLRNSYFALILFFMAFPAFLGCLATPFFFAMAGFDALSIMVSGSGLRLGDRIAGTQVVQTVEV